MLLYFYFLSRKLKKVIPVERPWLLFYSPSNLRSSLHVYFFKWGERDFFKSFPGMQWYFKKGRKEGRKPSFPIPTAQGDSETWKGIFGPVVSLTLLLHRFKTNVLKIFRDELISRSLPSEEGLSRHTTHSSQPLEHFSSNLPASPRQPHTQTRLPPNIKWQHRSKAKQRFSTHESLVSKRSYLYALSVILEHTAPFKWENIFLG